MIKGISFKISQSLKSKVLYQIFDCINIEQLCFYNIESQHESWRNQDGDELFTKSFYSSEEFIQLVSSEAYVIFLKLQIYFILHRFKEIHTYAEFKNSDCQLLLLINDGEFVDIYIKDIEITKAIYRTAIHNNYIDVQYIRDNDDRKRMDVL